MNTIVPVQPALPPQNPTAQIVPQEARISDLRAEQVVRASVAEGGQDQVRLQFGDRTLLAETYVALRTGQKVALQVVATSPRLELRLVDDLLAERISRSFHLLGGRWEIFPPIRDLLGGSPSLFDRLSPSARLGLEIWMAVQGFAYEKADREFLRHLYGRLGLSLEARLARGEGKGAAETLKGALLELAALVKESEPSMAERIGRLLKTIELFQLCQARLSEGEVHFLPLPLPWLEQGYLLADQRREDEEEGDNPFRLSLHLKLQGLGDLSVDILHDSDGVHLRFSADSTEKAVFLSSYQDELRDALGEDLQGLVFTAGAVDPAAALLKRVLKDGSGHLDTRV